MKSSTSLTIKTIPKVCFWSVSSLVGDENSESERGGATNILESKRHSLALTARPLPAEQRL